MNSAENKIRDRASEIQINKQRVKEKIREKERERE